MNASKIGKAIYPPEIAEINGIASRYSYSKYDDIALQVYELGLKHYPNYFGFHLSTYDLLANKNKKRAKEHLLKSEYLLKNIEDDWQGKNNILNGIKKQKEKNGW